MPEFLHLVPPIEALNRLLDSLPSRTNVAAEEIGTVDALGRVTASVVIAPHPLPAFPRSTVDGYAVRAVDTYGASESLPVYLKIVGEIQMGAHAGIQLGPGEGALIHTGGMLPENADAVVMVENTQAIASVGGPGEIEVLRAVAANENVLKVGEDVFTGQEVLPPGARIRPAEIGGAMALGVVRLSVAYRPKVGIISSGDEVIPPQQEPGPGQVRDVNAYSLHALVQQAGGEAVHYGIVPDSLPALQDVAARALAACDLVIITAGSSASTRDLTAGVINALGAPGVLVHGLNVRPGKPTILGVCQGKAVIGLPGNPVSALVIAGLFVVPVIETLLGMSRPGFRPGVTARLSVNIASQAGREDWVPVRLEVDAAGYRAEPVFGKSNLIFSLARADGLVRVPPDATGLSAGELVAVSLL